HKRPGKCSPHACGLSWTASHPFTGPGKYGLDITILSTWRPHKWSQFRSLIASKAASTMRRFCSTVISVFSSRERMEAGLYRWITDAAVSLDRRTVDRTGPQIRVTQSL